MSSFLGFCEWNTRNRWGDGQVCPDVDKELWRLGPDSSGDEKTRKERSRKSSEKTRADRLRKRRGESQSFLLGDADQESETRMSKNALRTGRRQAVDKVKAICNGPRNFEPRSSDMDDIQVSILFSKLSHQGSMKTVGLQWL
ncbi:hypothetical protein TNCV_696731 [Trichonephila clavipes]|nr:hypothetical protein TNCV_696731 [Trichonephila clavipes]